MVYTYALLLRSIFLTMTEEQLRAQLDALRSSTSWKITAPLRLLVRMSKALLNYRQLRVVIKQIFLSLARRTIQNAQLRSWVHRVLRPFPKLKARLTKQYLYAALTSSANLPITASNAGDLSPAANTILRELHAAIGKNK